MIKINFGVIHYPNMTANEQVISQFYTAFQQGDYRRMQACYADEAVFNDSVFTNLNVEQTKAMWQMLISRSNDLTISFGNIHEVENKVTAYWEAHYTFTATGNKVTNRINAVFELEQGKIVAHTDSFNFYTWAKQAFGMGGLLLGWTTFFKEKVRQTAQKKLDAYMAKASQH